MVNGFALGGAADGFNQFRQTGINQQQVNQTGQYQQQEIALAQQAQKNQQQRELFARADKYVNDIMSHVGEAVKAAKLSGNSDVVIAQKLQGMVDTAAKLRKSAGGDDSTVRALFATMLATPTTLTPAEMKPVVSGEDVLGKTYSQWDPKTQKYVPITQDGNDVQAGTKMPPGQNLTGPNTRITGIDVQNSPVPSVQPQSSLSPVTDPITNKLFAAGVITPEVLDFQAERVRQGAKITDVTGTGYGKLNQAIRSAIQKRAAELAIAHGQNPTDANVNKANMAGQSAALTKMIGMKQSIEQFENTALKNGDVLVKLAEKVDQTGVPVIERWTRAGRRSVAGDVAVSNFNIQMQLWRTEVAKILTNPNMTGILSDSSRAEVAAALGDNATYPQIKAANELLKGDFSRRSSAIDEQIATIKKSFNPNTANQKDSSPKSQDRVINYKDYFGGSQ